MPSRRRPKLARELADAADALGSHMRLAILQSLGEDGPATQAELARRLDVEHRATVGDHLKVLEDLRLVTVDPSRDEAGPLRRRYAIEPQRYAAITRALVKLNPDKGLMSEELRTLLEQ